MSDETSAPQGTATGEPAPREFVRKEKALRWFEISLVLIVSFGSSLLSSFRFVIAGQTAAQPQHSLDWSYLILQEVTGLLLLGYILWRRRLTFRDLGLGWSPGEPLVGVLVAIVAYLSYAAAYTLIHLAHRTVFHAAAQSGASTREIFGLPSLLVVIPMVLLNPIFEELIVRAYVMKEVRELTGSWFVAGAMSVAVQTAYHLYYGWSGALSVGAEFLVFSIYYARTRKATPIIVAHAILDAYGFSRLM